MKKIFLMVMIVLLITACGTKKVNNGDEINYASIEAKMLEYYDEYYNSIKGNLSEEHKEIDFRLTLKNLETAGYDLSMFKNIDNNEPCDLDESFAIIDRTPDKQKYPNNDYVISVYYKCGDYVNKEYLPGIN